MDTFRLLFSEGGVGRGVRLLTAMLWLALVAEQAGAQDPSHDYPLIGWQTFAGAVDDFYARFDYLVYRHSDESRVNALKALNPDMRIVWTFDWNSGNVGEPIGSGSDLPDVWKLKDSRGNILNSYGNLPMFNLSEFSPRAPSGKYAGLTYLEAIPEIFEEMADLNTFDGWGTNGAWGPTAVQWLFTTQFKDDVDINNNGINDHNEFSPVEWETHWENGLNILLNGLREKLNAAEQATGQPKLLVINSGTYHTWGWPQTNGIVIEKLRTHFDDEFRRHYWLDFAANGRRPFYSVADGYPEPSAPNLPANTKNDFRGMRFGLVTSMFNDVYFSFQSIEAGEHYWSYWYDEFEVSVGQPTSPPLQIREGAWVRFFEKGVALASTDGRTQTISDADLRAFSQYAGPYYRFQGSQDPAMNNGAEFSSVTLAGDRLQTGGTAVKRLGDGILLLTEPKPVIADIIIDDNDTGTSPANNKAELDGFVVQEDCRNGRDFYRVRCSNWLDAFGYAYTSPGSGTATFRPNVGAAGYYEVFEWHGQMDNAPMATNVSYTIKHGNGETTRTVDQSSQQGLWNSLGTYYFPTGRNNYVQIDATEADGFVMADAVKFVFKSLDENADLTPPAPPANVRVEQ